jgi:hypothetical protein
VVNYLSLDPRPVQSVLSEGKEAAEHLSNAPGQFRVYSPSYSLPQQTAAIYSLQLADGVDPLQLAAYVRFMEKATGVPSLGYSVTLPPFAAGDPQKDNQDHKPDLSLLRLLDVQYIAAAFDLDMPGLSLVQHFGETRLYKIDLPAPPRAWVNSPAGGSDQAAGQALITRWEPDKIELTAQGEGTLVLSEIYYPGWRAWVDGKEVAVVAVDGLLRGVPLSPGPHQVILRFLPTSVYIGLALAAVAWIGVISGRLKEKLSTRRRT